MTYDYYYGEESESFSFYRVPRLLVTGEQFRGLSSDAKLLYGLLLDRMGLSAKNGWYDELQRVYIYYTLDEIEEDMNCGHDKATKLLRELEASSSGGLIERVKQGLGKPARIYVKRFTANAAPTPAPEHRHTPSPVRDFRAPCRDNAALQTAVFPHSGLRESSGPDCGKPAGNYNNQNYTENNHTDLSYTNPSIYPSVSAEEDGMDGCDAAELVKEQIEYDILLRERKLPRTELDSIVRIMRDVLYKRHASFRINGGDYDAEEVKAVFREITREHIEFIFEALDNSRTSIKHTHAYMLTALYNSVADLDFYVAAQVRRDMAM